MSDASRQFVFLLIMFIRINEIQNKTRMHYRKIFAPAVLSALLVCLHFSGCSLPEERRDALDNIEWDAASVEPEYLT